MPKVFLLPAKNIISIKAIRPVAITILVRKNGKSKFVDITTGIRLANNVEITKGVSAGDTLVVTGVLFVRPNAQVKIRSVKTLSQTDSL